MPGGWRGALATTIPDEKLIFGDFKKLEGFVYGKDGFPVTRPGWRVLGNGLATGNIRHLASFYPTPDTAFLMVYTDPPVDATGGEKPTLWAWHRNDSFEALGRGAIDYPAPALGRPVSASAGGRWYFSYNSPSDHRLLFFDGNVTTKSGLNETIGDVKEVSDAPEVEKLFFVDNRLWVVVPNARSTLRSSAPDDATNWTVNTNEGVRLPITAGDGGTISSIVSYGGTKFVFKDDPDGGSIHRLNESINSSGDIEFSRQTFTDEIGAVSHQVVMAVADKFLLFASRYGIHTLERTDKFGDLDSTYVDFEVSDIWRRLSLRQQRNAILVDDAKNDQVLLSYDDDGDGFNDRVIFINYARLSPRQRFSFSVDTWGFDAATLLSMASTINNDLVVGRLF